MKLRPLALSFALIPLIGASQEYSSSFNALRMPVSSHVAAIGGQSVSLIEDSPAAGWANPALYANASDLSLSFGFMSYLSGSAWMGAHFTKAFGERHTLAVGMQYMNYGRMDETDENGLTSGTFNPKDIVAGAGYSYLLSDRWSGGANFKLMTSSLAEYTSVAVAVDIGLNYYDEETDLSLSAAAQHIGTQVKAYDPDRRSHLPFSLTLGLSKGMAHLPVRFHLTLVDLTRWKSSYYVSGNADEEGKKVSFSRKALNHIVAGVEVLPTDYLYLSLGYNFRRADELAAAGTSHWAGITAGGGVTIKRFSIGLSYAQYHQAGGSLFCDAGYRF